MEDGRNLNLELQQAMNSWRSASANNLILLDKIQRLELEIENLETENKALRIQLDEVYFG